MGGLETDQGEGERSCTRGHDKSGNEDVCPSLPPALPPSLPTHSFIKSMSRRLEVEWAAMEEEVGAEDEYDIFFSFFSFFVFSVFSFFLFSGGASDST